MNNWMERLITQGYTLQFASPPPPFNGMLETFMSSWTEIAADHRVSRKMEKGEISPVTTGEESKGFYSTTSLFPRKWGE